MSNAFCRSVLVLFAAMLLTSCFALNVHAQTAAGVELRPASIEPNLAVQPGSTLEYEITVSNVSSQAQTFYLLKKDIIGAGDNGAPLFASDELETTGFEISTWITLASEELTIEPNGSAPLKFTVTVPENASPGSHFGGIFISHEPPRSRETGAAIGYEVGSIISLRVAGDVKEQGTIRSFSTGNYVYGSLSVDFHARIDNEGSTLIRPFGPLEVYNMFGKRVATLTFNESQSGIFPGQTRDFSLQWSDDGTGFGRYTADVSLIYGLPGAQQTMSNSLSFWVLPMNIIGPALAVLAVLLLIVYVSVRMYVRRQLSMAGVSKRRVASRHRGPDSSAFLLVFVSMLTVTALFLIILLVLFA